MKRLILSLAISGVSFSSFAQISGPDSVCAGATITLTSTPSFGTWSSSNPAIATVGSTGIVTGVAPGVDTILFAPPGLALFMHVVTVDPAPAAITGPDSVCVGLAITLTDATSGGMWSSGTPSVAAVGTTTGTVTGMAGGTAVITYTAGGCFTTDTVTVTVCTTNVTGYASGGKRASIFPNPAFETLTIETDQATYHSFVITNELGRAVLQLTIKSPQTIADIKTLPPGLYYFLLKGTNESQAGKFVRE